MTYEEEQLAVRAVMAGENNDDVNAVKDAWESACERARVASERAEQMTREANMQANRAAVAESNEKAAKRAYESLNTKAARYEVRIAAWEKHSQAMRRAFLELGITGDDE